jgi:hypothetical protein
MDKQNDQTPTQPQKVDSYNDPNDHLANQNNIHNHMDNTIPQDQAEHNLQHANIPEEAIRMIKRNKQIMYKQMLLDIDNINMNVQQRLATEQMTPRFIRQLQFIRKHLFRLRNRQVGLEDKLRKISTISSQ